MARKHLAIWMTVVALLFGRHAAGQAVNLLPNGGFETDANGDGVADGWVALDFNFSRQGLAEVQAYIEQLPTHEALLAGEQILAADGTPIWTRKDGDWPEHMLTFGSHYWGAYELSWQPEVNWYGRVKDEAIPQASRFGELPVPEDLNLGAATLMLTNGRSHKQVLSEPITVKPDTGYRLAFWVRTSGGGEYFRGPQVLDGACDLDTVSALPNPGMHYNNANVLNSFPGSYWWGSGIAGRYWARLELPFRTGRNCSSIVIRLPFNHRDEAKRREMGIDHYRIWYDDLRLVEDPTVHGIGPAHDTVTHAAPAWPAAVKERGFGLVGRPVLPLTYGNFQPKSEAIDAPVRLTLAPGESDSAVLFVRNLSANAITLQAKGGGELESDDGYGLHGAYGAPYVTIRAAEIETRFLTSKRFAYTPRHLLNTRDLSLTTHSSGQYWVTVAVPRGTPAGSYTATFTVTRTSPADGNAATRRATVPLILTVRDMDLEAADAAFFTWYHTVPASGEAHQGDPSALFGAEEIYFADQRRHGMNTVALHCYAEGLSKDGQVRVSLNELDAMVERVRRGGLCREQPLLLSAWSRAMERPNKSVSGSSYTFCSFAGGKDTVKTIVDHAKLTGWPELLFAVGDEPNYDQGARVVADVINGQYAEARKRGVRTATAGGYPGAFTRPRNEKGDTLGELYDVWIEGHYGDRWPQMHEAARKNDAELWMYNCWVTGAGYLQERFHAGLWTWRTGAKGNGVWSYGWYVRLDKAGLPESKLAWEGRAAGVNDYRYLQTLEHTIAAGEASGKAGAAVQGARAYLDELRIKIPLTTYRQRPSAPSQHQWAELDAWNPVPEIRPEDYAGIRNDCARHTAAIRGECGL